MNHSRSENFIINIIIKRFTLGLNFTSYQIPHHLQDIKLFICLYQNFMKLFFPWPVQQVYRILFHVEHHTRNCVPAWNCWGLIQKNTSKNLVEPLRWIYKIKKISCVNFQLVSVCFLCLVIWQQDLFLIEVLELLSNCLNRFIHDFCWRKTSG